jgi:hypothetical protein
MRIKLVQSGGIAGKKMAASAEHKLTKKEWDELVGALKRRSSTRSVKDGISYILQNEKDENSKAVIDIEAIPEKYEGLFKKLFDRLKADR